ncbi:KGGVGR-motif variant AAA ATPase [Paraburkholderia bannensis]|uniref:KGGVGR-motif variant AAA ATPase n=1 Tax=Paraburkholderia bannensis TaxID=765414 RepID=UPI002AB64903|nr:division plane positioning ATPase MipZ [Paraburkholderia bannensis]
MKSKVTTFYSYKGGSGRSMAMANVAWALATNGEKVLTIDWDLEAPGLHRYFHPFLEDPSQVQSLGLMDYVWSYIGQLTGGNAGRDFDAIDPASLVQELQLPFEGTGCLHFIGAGVQDDNYSDKVGGLDWGTFYGRFGGESFLNSFMDWARSNYTHILIDSRTGVADSAGVCTMQLPDTVVMCTVYNRQSIEGTAAVARSIARNRRERHRSDADIWIVPSRVEDRNNVTAARLHCVKLLKDTLRSETNLAAQLRISEIKHYPWCSFEEKLAVFEELPGDNGSLLDAMHRLASRISARTISPINIDSTLLTNYWRRAAFEDPRLAELDALSSAPDSETVAKLVHWLDEAVTGEHDRQDWLGALGLACVRQANVLGEIEGRAAEFLSDQGFELACIAYAHDRRGYRSRFASALQARADFLQRAGHLEEALKHARHAVKLIDAKSRIAPWRRARAFERFAELTLATRGPVEALPLYKKMASLFDGLDLQNLPASAINDALRAQRLLAEQHVQLEDHISALAVVKKALGEIQQQRRIHRRSIPEAANLLGLYAEISMLVFPENSANILSEVRSIAEAVIDSRSSAAVLDRKLAIIESGVHVRGNRMDDALAAIAQLNRSNDPKALAAEPQLDETWEAQAVLSLSFQRYAEAQGFLTDRIRHSTRGPSPRLCELILELIKHTGDPQPLYDLILKRVGPGGIDVHEQTMLSQVLARAMEILQEDKRPVLQFLRETLERAGGRPSSSSVEA